MDIENRKINFEKLISYGFYKNNDFYEYRVPLKNGKFELIVKFSEIGDLKTQIIDLDTKEEYVLVNVLSATGEYVGEIRKEQEEILKKIFEKCSDIEVFQSDSAKQVICYVKEKYGDEPEFLWEKFDGNAVFRHKENKKWYGVLLTICKRKLGLDSDEMVEIIDLKIAPEKLEKIADGKKYFLGYHMNKKHWVTMMLDGSVPMEEIFEFLDDSFEMK